MLLWNKSSPVGTIWILLKKNCLKNWKIRFWNHAERRITGQFPLTIYLSCHVVEEKRIFEFFLLCFYSFMQNHSCRLEYMHDSPDSPVSCKQNQITIFLLNCLFFSSVIFPQRLSNVSEIDYLKFIWKNVNCNILQLLFQI